MIVWYFCVIHLRDYNWYTENQNDVLDVHI